MKQAHKTGTTECGWSHGIPVSDVGGVPPVRRSVVVVVVVVVVFTLSHPGLSVQHLVLSQHLRTNPKLDAANFRGHRLTHLEKAY